ncbi:Nose resistant to fluoxetine protein 6 [Araneus ventricosus]|uniref:Nose resistant to fluoxetine protein 6 n=1 Tax=Araneus ventricosus TaxID=182803 RepID=A0A4Y2HT07_ARAVE|nr:Nose resistant to fluoxetine protein 6 [Araneus ventricosus]
MKNSTYLSCNGVPWQATIPCLSLNFKDKLLAAIQAPEIIHERAPKKLTEEAVYVICVMLTFVGLAVLGSSVTAYEFFFKDNEKKVESPKNGCKENTTKLIMRILKGKKPSESHDFLEGGKSFLKCFCILRNGSKILSTASPEGEIDCFHGLRFLCNVWIIGFHTAYMYVGILRHVEEIKSLFDWRGSQLLLNGGFAVDVFFVISGFLNANALFHKYSRSNGNISWFYFYFKRFVRLTPVYMIVLGFNATLISYTGTGIIWPTYGTNPVCRKDWWWHLLYINNFEESAQECLPLCWYMAVDMQFYVISPLFMVSLIRFWEYFDVVYVKPYARIIPYLVAILLAYYLHKKNFDNGTTRNSAITLCCGWIVTVIFMWICFFSLHKKEEILIVTAIYNGTKHLLFSCGFAWMIYLVLTRQSEFLNMCLSWKLFLPLSRLSYCAYLIHPLVLSRLSLQSQDFMDFSFISMIWLYLYVCVFTYSVSFIASLLFEAPVLNLLDWFSKKKGKKNSRVTSFSPTFNHFKIV